MPNIPVIIVVDTQEIVSLDIAYIVGTKHHASSDFALNAYIHLH